MEVSKRGRRTSITRLAAICTVLWSAAPQPVGASEGDFDYAVERVSIDGNLWGPHDGTPDAMEETFDPHINPIYHIPNPPYGFVIPFDPFFGNAQPIDGALHLMSPGTLLDLPSLGLTLIQSDVVSESPILRDGAGDARFEVAFQAATLPVNQYLHATFSLAGPTGGGFAGLAFANFDAVVAQQQLGPAIAGLSMFAHVLNGYIPTGGQSFPVDPAAAGGPFVLALDYDDTAKTITPSYSLDGGSTFTGGFDPLPILAFDGSGIGTGNLMIGADPRTTFDPSACPTGLWRRLSHQRLTVVRGRDNSSKLSFKAEGLLDSLARVFNPVGEGAQLTITDRGTSLALVNLSGSAAVPPGAPGSGCDPRDGWTAVGVNRFTYRNYSNALPPGCAPSSANGLTLMKLALRNLYQLHVVATATVPNDPASVVGPVSSLFVRGRGGNSDDAGACLAVVGNDVSCEARTRAVRCKY
jgi:hypothetical protein